MWRCAYGSAEPVRPWLAEPAHARLRLPAVWRDTARIRWMCACWAVRWPSSGIRITGMWRCVAPQQKCSPESSTCNNLVFGRIPIAGWSYWHRKKRRIKNKDEYRTERLPGEVSCGRWLCFFILDTYAAFVGKRKNTYKIHKNNWQKNKACVWWNYSLGIIIWLKW